MPERVPLALHWDPGNIRKEVIDTAPNVVLSTAAGEVRVLAVPLFRETEQGLQQALRVESNPRLAGGTVSVATESGSELDRLTLDDTGRGHLFVPEVDGPTRFELTLAA